MKQPINWNALVSELLLALGFISMIPYSQGNFMADIVPVAWIPYLIKIGIGAGAFIRLWPHLAVALNNIFGWSLPTTVPAPATALVPQAGAVQTTLTK